MKKLIYKFALLAVLLVLMNWIYGKFFFKNDLIKHSDEIEYVWKVTEDSCIMIYTGESSNHTCAPTDNDRRKISDFVFDHFPSLKCEDMTISAVHAEVYYYLLANIPETAQVKTVIVTMNLRSFGYKWIESDLETAIQKQLVLLKEAPPLFNRFRLAFKDYDIVSKEERTNRRIYHRKHDIIVFPYDFQYHTSHEWDNATNEKGVKNADGTRNTELTNRAITYIQNYGFQIHDNNPRLKDFDKIVKLAQKRGWNLVFNILAEDVEEAQKLVGNDLVFLMRQNRDILVNRYGNIDNVTIVDNLESVADRYFIERDFTSEHYTEQGRKCIGDNVAQSVKKFYPKEYVE